MASTSAEAKDPALGTNPTFEDPQVLPIAKGENHQKELAGKEGEKRAAPHPATGRHGYNWMHWSWWANTENHDGNLRIELQLPPPIYLLGLLLLLPLLAFFFFPTSTLQSTANSLPTEPIITTTPSSFNQSIPAPFTMSSAEQT